MSESIFPSNNPHQTPGRRQFLRNAGLAFFGASSCLPSAADDGAEHLEWASRVPATEAWTHFGEQLAAALTDLGVDEYLVIDVRRRRSRYVSLYCGPTTAAKLRREAHMSNAEFEQHARDSRRMCMSCHGRNARFHYRGEVRADRHHTLCFRCHRAPVNRLRSQAVAFGL